MLEKIKSLGNVSQYILTSQGGVWKWALLDEVLNCLYVGERRENYQFWQICV